MPASTPPSPPLLPVATPLLLEELPRGPLLLLFETPLLLDEEEELELSLPELLLDEPVLEGVPLLLLLEVPRGDGAVVFGGSPGSAAQAMPKDVAAATATTRRAAWRGIGLLAPIVGRRLRA
jgi:hypothetical protein